MRKKPSVERSRGGWVDAAELRPREEVTAQRGRTGVGGAVEIGGANEGCAGWRKQMRGGGARE